MAARRQQSLHLVRRAELGARRIDRESRERFRALSSLLDSLSPLSVLDRGYALCLDPKTAALITDTRRLPADGRVEVRLRRGRIGCDIREVTHAQNNEEDS